MAPAFVETIGALAAILTTLCWVPQALKIVRDRETRQFHCRNVAVRSRGPAMVDLWRGNRRPAADRVERHYLRHNGDDPGAENPSRLIRCPACPR